MRFVETRVQGDGAEIDIAEAIDRASREDVDAIVVLRGGGSYEDRYPFNTEPVVRAIVRSRHPVVTAIGHTGDRHLADEVADARLQDADGGGRVYRAARGSEVTGRLARQQRAASPRAIERVDRATERSVAIGRASARSRHRAASFAQSRRRLLELQNRIERQNPAPAGSLAAQRA